MQKSAIHKVRRSQSIGSLGFVAVGLCCALQCLSSQASAQQPAHGSQHSTRKMPADPNHVGNSSRESKEAATQRIPFQQLTPEANARLHSVIDNSSYFRHMPTETMDCDQEMFTFLVRNPDVIVNIWDIMGVTKVSLKRTGPFQLQGTDGAGTSSKMDLVFGNDTMHIYFASGSYHGNLWARELNGKCVVILHNRPTQLPNGKKGITASMDVFMKLDNLGADLVVKTLGPLVGKTADYNFSECAAFISQISQTAENNPYGIQQLATRLDVIDPKTRDQFIATTLSVAKRSGNLPEGVISKQAAAHLKASAEKVPILTMQPMSARVPSAIPSADTSTRRQSESSSDASEERVDSPTILLIGKEEKNQPARP